MRKMPTISPMSANERLKTDPGGFVLDGFHYWLEGPQMSPPEAWSPFAMLRHEDTNITFFVWGDMEQDIHEMSQWGWTDGTDYGLADKEWERSGT